MEGFKKLSRWNIMVKGAGKGSSVVVWDSDDYLQEASRQLWDTNIYKDVKFNENILTGLVERSNKIFDRLCSHFQEGYQSRKVTFSP